MFTHVWTFVLIAGALASADALGTPTSIEQYPSLVQVEFYIDGSWLQQCAATIITNRHVLSAASGFSGVDYNPNYRRIRAGTSTRGVDGQVRVVQSALNHPDYGTLDQDADISVVALGEYLVLGATVQQAPILGQGIELPFGLLVRLAGWGTTAEGGNTANDNLYTVDLFVGDDESCLIKYIFDKTITENMICVGLSYYVGRDLDQTDVGASLFYEDTMVGLLSFGKDDADDEYPVVATNVGSYTSWIIANAV